MEFIALSLKQNTLAVARFTIFKNIERGNSRILLLSFIFCGNVKEKIDNLGKVVNLT